MLNPEEGGASHDCCANRTDMQNREYLLNQTNNVVIKSFRQPPYEFHFYFIDVVFVDASIDSLSNFKGGVE